MEAFNDEEVDNIIHCTMQEAFEVEPRNFQIIVLCKLIKMLLGYTPITPVFMCQPTSGGKLIVWDTYAVAVGGITINIVSLLSLNVDQHNKLQTSKKCDNIYSIHLDEYNERNEVNAIVEMLKSIPENSPVSIVLFSSPQRLVDFKQYRDIILILMRNDTLKLLFVDEVYLFTQFGLWLRLEFLNLKDVLFQEIKHQIPMLFMTASDNMRILRQLKLLTDIDFSQNNTLWPNTFGMKYKKQVILFSPTSQFHQIL